MSRQRVVWVTGAAGGIGRAIADAWVEAGAHVVASDVRTVVSRPGVTGISCDVTSASSVESAIGECERLGGIDVLVNSAGIMRRANVLEMTAREWDEVFDVNLRGPFLCSQAAARAMIAGGRGGAIVHVGSVNAEKVFADSVAYCSSKGALHMLGKSMALALAEHGIRVNVVAPGAIHDTDLEPARWRKQAERDSMARRTPMGRLGEARDVAGAAVFLGSDAARFITGATLYVDGGRTASV